MYDYSKLLGVMKERGITQDVLAENIGMSPVSLNKKLRNNSQFKQLEMQKILKVLDLPIDTIYIYFFTPKLAFSQVK